MLSETIKVLLNKEEYVILPGLGGFMTQHRPAWLESSTGKLFPPRKQPAFNGNLTNDDGSLTANIAESQNITRKEASELLKLEIEKINKELTEKGTYSFEGIGVLAMDNQDRITFEPSPAGIDMPASYGLTELSVKKLRSYPQPKILRKRKLKQKKQYFPVAAVLIPLIICGLALAMWIQHPFIEDRMNNFAGFNGNDYTEYTGDRNQATEDEESGEQVSTASVAPMIVGRSYIERNKTTTESITKHYIIGGSFSQPANAEQFASEYSNKGYNTEILESDEGFYRVSLAVFDDEQAAKAKQNQIQNTSISQAWILTN